MLDQVIQALQASLPGHDSGIVRQACSQSSMWTPSHARVCRGGKDMVLFLKWCTSPLRTDTSGKSLSASSFQRPPTARLLVCVPFSCRLWSLWGEAVMGLFLSQESGRHIAHFVADVDNRKADWEALEIAARGAALEASLRRTRLQAGAADARWSRSLAASLQSQAAPRSKARICHCCARPMTVV